MRVSTFFSRRGLPLILAASCLLSPGMLRAEQETLADGAAGDGHMEIRGDQYGAFGPFSVKNPGAGSYNPTGPVGMRPWVYWSALMLTDGANFQWLMDADDWPGDFGAGLLDDEVISDTSTGSTRNSSFNVSLFSGLRVDLAQEVTPHNILQTYTFHNDGNSALDLKALWETDVDMEFAQDALSNFAGIVLGDEPRVYFIEESDVAGAGDPGVADRNRRISVIASPGDNVEVEGAMAFRPPVGSGGGTHLHFYAQQMQGIEEDYLNGVWQIVRGSGQPTDPIDENGDNLMDEPGDTGGAMQFGLNIPAKGQATLKLNFVGGSLKNSVLGSAQPGDFNSDGVLDVKDIDALTAASGAGTNNPAFDLNADNVVNSVDVNRWVKDLAKSWIGDANLDGEFNSADFVDVFQKGKYETNQAAVWSEGDWDGSGKFDSSDFIAAFQDGGYEQGKRAAVSAVPEPSSLAICFLAGVALTGFRRQRSK